MRATVENLFALQQLQLQTVPASAERNAKIRKLREKIPVPVLSHFDRLMAMGDEFVKKSKELGRRAEMFTAEGQPHGFFNRSRIGAATPRLSTSTGD